MIALIHKILKVFKNKGDVFYSEGDINMGLQVSDYIKVISLSDTVEAQKVEDFIQVGEEIYGNEFSNSIKNGKIEASDLWKEVRLRITNNLEKDLNIDQLDSTILTLLEKFYYHIENFEISNAQLITQKILK